MKGLFLVTVFILSVTAARGQPASCYTGSRSDRVNVIIFLATDCPISQKYIPVLNSIFEKYRERNVKFTSLVPGRKKQQDIAEFAREYEIAFPVNDDRDFLCVKDLAAEATPEVFVFDAMNALRYRGAIDNWFYDLGGYRKQSTENY